MCALGVLAVLYLDRDDLALGAPILTLAMVSVLLVFKKFTAKNSDDIEAFVRRRDWKALRRMTFGAKTEQTRKEDR